MILAAIAVIVDSSYPDGMILSVILSGFLAIAGISFKDQSFLVNVPIGLLACIVIIALEYVVLDLILAVSLVSGSVISIPIARFANRNFSEIVSRRMRWRSSNVVLFEEKWKYVINRYLVCTFGICSIMFYVLSAPFSMSHTNLVNQKESPVEHTAGSADNSVPAVDFAADVYPDFCGVAGEGYIDRVLHS